MITTLVKNKPHNCKKEITNGYVTTICEKQCGRCRENLNYPSKKEDEQDKK